MQRGGGGEKARGERCRHVHTHKSDGAGRGGDIMATIVRLEASPLAFGRSAAPLPIIIAQRPYQPHHHRPTLSPAARLCGWGHRLCPSVTRSASPNRSTMTMVGDGVPSPPGHHHHRPSPSTVLVAGPSCHGDLMVTVKISWRVVSGGVMVIKVETFHPSDDAPSHTASCPQSSRPTTGRRRASERLNRWWRGPTNSIHGAGD